MRKVILFMLLFGSLGQASADLEMVVDLMDGQESMLLGRDAAVCEQRCLEVHRVGGYAFFALRDDKGQISYQVSPWLDDREDYGLQSVISGSSPAWDAQGGKKPLVGSGGNCGHNKANCIETFIVSGGHVIAIEHGPRGEIKSFKALPVLSEKK